MLSSPDSKRVCLESDQQEMSAVQQHNVSGLQEDQEQQGGAVDQPTCKNALHPMVVECHPLLHLGTHKV